LRRKNGLSRFNLGIHRKGAKKILFFTAETRRRRGFIFVVDKVIVDQDLMSLPGYGEVTISTKELSVLCVFAVNQYREYGGQCPSKL
jgi:hypothetical protein